MVRTWTLLFIGLCACGEIPSAQPAPVDGGGNGKADAQTTPDPDGPPDLPPVTVTVTAGSAPIAGIDVIFHDPGGSVLAHKQTDANGEAEHQVPPMGIVTVAGKEGDRPRLGSVAGVMPGDKIPFDVTPPDGGQVRVTYGAPSADAKVWVSDGCESATTDEPPVLLKVGPRCLQDNRVSVLALVMGAPDPSEFSFIKAEPSGTGTLTLPAWRSDFTALDLLVETNLANAHAVLANAYPVVDGIPFARPGRSAPLLVQPRYSTRFLLPSGFGLTRWDATILYNNNLRPDAVTIITVADGSEGSGYAPITAATVPLVTGAQNQGDAVVWEVSGNTADMDLIAVLFRWHVNAAAGSRVVGVWSVFLPPGTPAPLRPPALPSALGSFAPTADRLMPSVLAVATTLVKDYDEFRSEVGGTFGVARISKRYTMILSQSGNLTE